MIGLELLYYALLLMFAFIIALLVGAGIALLLGYDLNEPEYYDRNKDNDTL